MAAALPLVSEAEPACIFACICHVASHPFQQKGPVSRAFLKRMNGLEPSTFCMASRADGQDARQRIATIGINHAGFRRLRPARPAWFREAGSDVWGMSGARAYATVKNASAAAVSARMAPSLTRSE